jgi:hypothetical protein
MSFVTIDDVAFDFIMNYFDMFSKLAHIAAHKFTEFTEMVFDLTMNRFDMPFQRSVMYRCEATYMANFIFYFYMNRQNVYLKVLFVSDIITLIAGLVMLIFVHRCHVFTKMEGVLTAMFT